MIQERMELSRERLVDIRKQLDRNNPKELFFAELINKLLIYEDIMNQDIEDEDIRRLKEYNHSLYRDILPENYGESFANPEYGVSVWGEDLGPVMSSLYAEVGSIIPYAYERNMNRILIYLELGIQIYLACADADYCPDTKIVKDIIYSFIYDYVEDMAEWRIREDIIPGFGVADEILETANLADLRYLFRYGEYISDDDIKLAEFINTLSEEEIDGIARTFTEGYRKGFELAGKDMSKRTTALVEYPIGMERVVRSSMELLEDMGLSAVFRRCESSFWNGRRLFKRGYYATNPNKQLDYDHENDRALFFDKKYMERIIEATRDTYEKLLKEARGMAGPAVIETFGEKPYESGACSKAIKPDEHCRELLKEYMARKGELDNKYLVGEERSFTIISFPSPAIGYDRFEEIFRETVKVNTLDYNLYRDIQQILIDELDKCSSVYIRGMNGNETDLTVALGELKNPEKETNFENCVADVNIPVGEVFTSPKLEGTNGILHVKKVFLSGRPYSNLKLSFKEGMISESSCDNFADKAKNDEYIRDNLLHNHKSLPLGEFAIGTNTDAYDMIKRYSLESVITILIMEKTGPHFAVGDTCYSREEDNVSYNPDGKAIVARENSVSATRKDNPLKAYFNCHTDITIPYDELGIIEGCTHEGSRIRIMENGRFVLKGLEILNVPLDR